MNNTPSRTNYDVVVIGAGHNGLVAAAYLAKAGKQVLVVEQRNTTGGAAGTEELFSGFRVDTGAVDAGAFQPAVAEDLNLETHGLRWIESPAIVHAPQPDGRSLTLWRDPAQAAEEIAAFSKSDAERYPDFIRLINRFSSVLEQMTTLTPPSLPERRSGELLPWLSSALKLKRMGDRELMEFMRVLPMPVKDFLDGWFESDALKAAIGASGVTGSLLGPLSSGTAFLLLYHAMHAGRAGFRSSRFVQGGMGALTGALAAAAMQRGAEICTGLKVARITMEDGRATGIQLENGQQIAARLVASNADPRRTFFGMVGAPHLDVSLIREVKNIRLCASLARVSLVLKSVPAFVSDKHRTSNDHLTGHIVICPDLEYLERAYDVAKYGWYSSQPMLDAVIPTLSDPSLAPPGAHMMHVDVYYAPYSLVESGWDEQRERLLETTLQTLESSAPGLRELIIEFRVSTPLDLERNFGLTNGDVYHGQMGLDQLLFMRPFAGSGRYRTPVENLFLCGAGTHPGGGVSGAPGYNAAREILHHLGEGG